MFINIPSLLPPDFFVITNKVEEIKIGHFTGEIINGRKSMIEIDLQSDGKYSLHMMGKKVDTENIGLQNHFLLTSRSVKSLLKIIAHLQYCRGMNTIEREELPHFQEHICSAGDDNSEIIQYRAKNCSKVLPFNASNASSYSACKNCKKIEQETKRECFVQIIRKFK